MADSSFYRFLIAYPNGILGHAGVSRRDPLTLQVEYDRLAIQGIWDVVSWTESGKRRSQSELKGNQLFVTADRLLVWNDKSLVASYAYEIDASREPGQIVVVRNETIGWGIYRLRDDSLTVCINRDGKRPREFRSAPGSGNDLWVVKSNSTSTPLVGAESWRSAHALRDQTEAEFIDTPLVEAKFSTLQARGQSLVVSSDDSGR